MHVMELEYEHAVCIFCGKWTDLFRYPDEDDLNDLKSYPFGDRHEDIDNWCDDHKWDWGLDGIYGDTVFFCPDCLAEHAVATKEDRYADFPAEVLEANSKPGCDLCSTAYALVSVPRTKNYGYPVYVTERADVRCHDGCGDVMEGCLTPDEWRLRVEHPDKCWDCGCGIDDSEEDGC